MTQNNLGTALSDRGERAEGQESVRLSVEAVAAFRQALEVSSRDQQPELWATVQDNLGNALSKEGTRAEAAFKNGRFVDIIEYGLLKKQFKKK